MQWKHALKTGLAAALALLISDALNWDRSVWAVLTAVVVMQSNLGSVFRASYQRLLGTALGGLFGVAVALLLPHDPSGGWYWTLPVGVIAVVTSTIFVCALLGWGDAYRVAGFTSALIVLSLDPRPWHMGFVRFCEVAMGILAALVVTLTVWPAPARRLLLEALARALTACGTIYDCVVAELLQTGQIPTLSSAQLDPALKDLESCRQLYQDLRSEPRSRNLENGVLLAIIASCERIEREVGGMIDMKAGPALEAVAREMKVPFAELSNRTREAFQILAQQLPNPMKHKLAIPHLSSAARALRDEFGAKHATLAIDNANVADWFTVFFLFRALRVIADELDAITLRLRQLD